MHFKSMFKRFSILLVIAMTFGMIYAPDVSFAADKSEINGSPQSNGAWDTVYFGSYYQEDTNGDGVADNKDSKQPILWRVLSVNGDDAYLISDKILDVCKYGYEVNEYQKWSECQIRDFLNVDFYNVAFGTEEKKAIISQSSLNGDNVFLISTEDLENQKYGFLVDECLRAYPTSYAIKRGGAKGYGTGVPGKVLKYEDYGMYWWARLNNSSSSTNSVISFTTINKTDWGDSNKLGVRPVIHVKLSSSKVTVGSKIDIFKYHNEWYSGYYFNADGTKTYKGYLAWRSDENGDYVIDTLGWYPQNEWVRIDCKWYYFTDSGYMDYGEYRDGCWLGYDGAWDEEYSGGHWLNDKKGWWYEDSSGWYPTDQWLWIDGTHYYFDSDGYCTNA